MTEEADIVVIGAGVAGSAVAAHLSEQARVIVLEMESQPGYHATGRSAALFLEWYGNPTIQALNRASRPVYFSPPPGFAASALVRTRPVISFARQGQEAALEAFGAAHAGRGRLVRLGADEAVRLCPILRREGLVGGFLDERSADIEVHELQQAYLRRLRARGGRLVASARVDALESDRRGWRVIAGGASFRAPTLVNAAGAWAGEIGAMAGAFDIRLQPRRRTAALVETSAPADGPSIADVGETFYAKPDAGLLLISPADETPSPPCDAAPDELDVAIAIDRLEAATTVTVRRVRSRWAGLRSFVADRSPVVGYDPARPGFFWLAALGGYGIQTAPALSRAAASLVLRRAIDADILAEGFDPRDVAPERFVATAA